MGNGSSFFVVILWQWHVVFPSKVIILCCNITKSKLIYGPPSYPWRRSSQSCYHYAENFSVASSNFCLKNKISFYISIWIRTVTKLLTISYIFIGIIKKCTVKNIRIKKELWAKYIARCNLRQTFYTDRIRPVQNISSWMTKKKTILRPERAEHSLTPCYYVRSPS